MYICICNAITENHVVAAIEDGASDVHDLGRSLGLGSGCGRCLATADTLLNRLCNTPDPKPVAADRLGVRNYAPA